MKQALIAILGIALAAGGALAQDKAPAKKPVAAKSAVSDALMHHEQLMLEALHKKDFAGFKKMVMPGTWAIDENGPMAVEDFLKAMEDPKANFSFEYKTSDMKVVTVDANTAIVTYKLDEKGTMMGQPMVPVVYASTVWTNHGGTWMGVFHQESTAAKR
jgi:hypothetical protein